MPINFESTSFGEENDDILFEADSNRWHIRCITVEPDHEALIAGTYGILTPEQAPIGEGLDALVLLNGVHVREMYRAGLLEAFLAETVMITEAILEVLAQD